MRNDWIRACSCAANPLQFRAPVRYPARPDMRVRRGQTIFELWTLYSSTTGQAIASAKWRFRGQEQNIE